MKLHMAIQLKHVLSAEMRQSEEKIHEQACGWFQDECDSAPARTRLPE
jgi:hypothetical protein